MSASPQSFRLVLDMPVLDKYDLVVAGGGPSGVSAAVCAARLGVNVLLVEATGCLGGMGTSGLVSRWSSISDGKRLHTRGLFREILKQLHSRGALHREGDPDTWGDILHASSGFHPEELKIVLDELCIEAGVDLLFATRVIDAEADPTRGVVKGVVIQHVEGYEYVPARAFIDATGDGTLSVQCGASARTAGTDTPHIMPATLCGLVTGFERPPSFDHEQEKLLQAFADGFFTQNDRHIPGLFTCVNDWGTINAGHLFGMDALKVRSLTQGYVTGRKLAAEYARFYREYFEEYKDLTLHSTAALMGVRESRSIRGEYELTQDDLRSRRHFPDQIAVYCKKIDVHVYDTSPEEWQRYRKEFTETDTFRRGETYGLPYGMLVPRGWQNLWVAGRLVSADVKAFGSLRDQPACYLTGQAAGTAAAQSIRTGQPAGRLNTRQLVGILRDNGAYLPQETLSEHMTRQDEGNE